MSGIRQSNSTTRFYGSIPVGFPMTVLPGSMLLVYIGAIGPTGFVINPPTDNIGNVYRPCGSGTSQSQLFYCPGCVGGNITITTNVTPVVDVEIIVIVAEVANVPALPDPFADAQWAEGTATGTYSIPAASARQYYFITSFAWTAVYLYVFPGAPIQSPTGSPAQTIEVSTGSPTAWMGMADLVLTNQPSSAVPITSGWDPGGHLGQIVFRIPPPASEVPIPAIPPYGCSIGVGGIVLCANNPPIATIGVAYSHALSVSGGTGPYVFSVDPSLPMPAGLNLNPSTGVVSGTPTEAGLPSFKVQVADSQGLFVYNIITIRISDGTTPSPPPSGALALSAYAPGGVVGIPYSFTFTASGGTPPYAYAITSGSLPPGLALDGATGAVAGAPTTAGTYSFTVEVTDGVAATATASVVVGISTSSSGGGGGTGTRPATGVGTWLRGTRPQDDHGWMLDAYAPAGAISRCSELTAISSNPNAAVSDKLIGIGGSLYVFTGENDAGSPIPIAIESRLDDCGDDRANKLIGDSILEVVTNKATNLASDLFLTLLGDPIAGGSATGYTGFIAQPIPNTAGTKVLQIWTPNQFNRTIGFRITGAIDGYNPEFYSFQPSYVPQPETVGQRIGDWSDDGKPGNKLVRGCVIEGDTAYASAGDLVVQADFVSVSSGTRPFVAGDVGAHLAIFSTVTWIPGLYVVMSVTAGTAVLDHAAASAAVSSGSFAIGNSKTFQVQGDGGTTRTTISVSHPGQSEAPYFWTPFETHEFRLVAQSSEDYRQWQVRWIYDDYPEFGQQVEDYIHLPEPMYVRGFEVEASTLGQIVPFQFQSDLGVVRAATQIQTQVREILAYGFPTPFICSEYRVVPLGPWEKFNLRLIGEKYPDFAAITTAHLFPANGRPAHIRGFNLRADTNGAAVAVRMMGDGNLLQTFTVNQQGESIPVPYVMGLPATVKVVQFIPNGNWRFWEVLWDAEEYPELTTERTKVISLGGCRRVQGMRLPADSLGEFAQFEVHGDNETLKIITAPTQFTGKTTFAFPRGNEWPPFFAHNVYLQPLTPARVWTDEIEWISEPAPDLATDYQTPPVTMNGTNYWSERWAWIAYISTQPVTLTVDADGVLESYTLPSSAGVYVRNMVMLLPRKAKWRVYCLSSPEPFRLYLQDSFILVKQWASTGPFTALHVFGDKSLDSGARI